MSLFAWLIYSGWYHHGLQEKGNSACWELWLRCWHSAYSTVWDKEFREVKPLLQTVEKRLQRGERDSKEKRPVATAEVHRGTGCWTRVGAVSTAAGGRAEVSSEAKAEAVCPWFGLCCESRREAKNGHERPSQERNPVLTWRTRGGCGLRALIGQGLP